MQEEMVAPLPPDDPSGLPSAARRAERDRVVTAVAGARMHLVAALSAAAPDNSSSRANLKDAVCDYVDAMRAVGATPEGTLISVKALARDALGTSYRSYGNGGPANVLIADVAQWCIARFFR